MNCVKKSTTRVGMILFLWALCLALVIATTGCRQKPTEEANDVEVQEPNETAPTIEEPNELVAATVNGMDVMEEDVQTIVSHEMQPMIDRADQYSAAMIEQRRKDIREKAIRKLVVLKLLDEEIEKEGITVSDQEVDEKIAEMAQQQSQPMTVEQLLDAVQEGGKSIETFKAETRRQLGYDKLFLEWVDGKNIVTEQEAQTYFDEHPDEFRQPESVTVSHILVRPIDETDPNSWAEARTRAEDLLKQIREGANFADVAMDHSDCPSSSVGGRLKPIIKGDMVDSFEKVAFSLKQGEISDIVKTQFGYHIIKQHEHRPEVVKTFAEVKDGIMEKLKTDKQLAVVSDYLKKLQDDANIKVSKATE